MLRNALKLEIDQLSEDQLKKIADFIALIKGQTHQLTKAAPFWQSATPLERAHDFRAWVSQLPQTNLSLPNDAFDRSSIYD